MSRTALRALALLAVAAGAFGCARVKPYERELLALPIMSLEDPDAAAWQHVLESREGSSGGAGQVGSGCGCN